MRLPRRHGRPPRRRQPALVNILVAALASLSRHASATGPASIPSYADDEKCKPLYHPPEPVPPCVEIETIEYLCYPNGTGPLYIEAHAQCMCKGSYFAEWTACRQCHFLNGQLSERDLTFYHSIASVASSALCAFLTPGPSPSTTASPPTVMFQDLFTMVEQSLASPTTGATSAVDLVRGNTAVSMYFNAATLTVPPGPGPITGSAERATATAALMTASTGSSIGTLGSARQTNTAQASGASDKGRLPRLLLRIRVPAGDFFMLLLLLFAASAVC